MPRCKKLRKRGVLILLSFLWLSLSNETLCLDVFTCCFMSLGECQRQCDEQRHCGQYQAENHALWDAWTAARPQRPCAFCPQRTCVHSHYLTTLTCHMEDVCSLTCLDIHTGIHAVFRWQRKDCDDGGCEVPPVCPSLALWERQNDLLHSSRRRIWTHVLPNQHPRESSSVSFTHYTVVHWQLEYLYIILAFTMYSCASFPYRWSLWYGLNQS